MEKVKNIQKIQPSDEEIKRYGTYARINCEVLIENENGEMVKNVYLDQSEILKYIESFYAFLDSEKVREFKNSRALKAEERRNKNMKYIWLYSLAFAGAVLAWIATSPVGIPIFIGFFVAGVTTALVVNDVFKRPEDVPGVQRVQKKIGEVMELENEAKEAIQTFQMFERERMRVDQSCLRYGIPTIENINNPKKWEEVKKRASFWNLARKRLNEQFEKSHQMIKDAIDNLEVNQNQYNNQFFKSDVAFENGKTRR